MKIFARVFNFCLAPSKPPEPVESPMAASRASGVSPAGFPVSSTATESARSPACPPAPPGFWASVPEPAVQDPHQLHGVVGENLSQTNPTPTSGRLLWPASLAQGAVGLSFRLVWGENTCSFGWRVRINFNSHLVIWWLCIKLFFLGGDWETLQNVLVGWPWRSKTCLLGWSSSAWPKWVGEETVSPDFMAEWVVPASISPLPQSIALGKEEWIKQPHLAHKVC